MKLLEMAIDFLFPPSREALMLRSINPENLSSYLTPPPLSPFPYITSLFAYKDPLAVELIWSIKYKKNRHAIECGAFAMHKVLGNQEAVLIPIPISHKRRKERGYNQCELLVDALAKLGQYEKRLDILFRSTHTERQTLKNREDRIKNTQDIFSAVSISLRHPIILIDDVTTTGSTFAEARNALIRAGYTDVRAMALAH